MKLPNLYVLLTVAGIAAAVGIGLATSSPTAAQRRGDWPSEQFNPQTRQRNVAGEFDYYALVLSWSPSYCASARRPDETQCGRSDGRRFSFVLHGLWPQYENGYPQSCRTRRRPFVPQDLINTMLDIMPSRGLIIHEYRKHGVCSGLDPQSYFGLSRRLFNAVRIPKRYENPFEMVSVSPRDLIREFSSANPNIPPQSIAVVCERGRNARLKELRICISRDGQPRACGKNENQRRLCSSDQVYLPPVRSTARDDQTGRRDRNTPPKELLPRPRLIESFGDL